MAESVGTRVRRLVSGGINALIDAVEGSAPEVVMDQTLREIDLAIAEVRNALGEALAGRHRATRRHAAENAELQQI